MTNADRAEFAALMLGLGETYGEPVSDARMEIYFAALADLELAEVRAAATAAVKGSTFFPRPSEIRELVAGRVEDRAELAWLDVVRLVRRVGYPGTDGRGKPPAFHDEVARRAALELFGGWVALCERLPAAGTPEFLGTAKQFKALYAAQDRTALAELPPSREEAIAILGGVKAELQKRGLPTGAL